MCFLIPAEISAVVTSFFSPPFFGCSPVFVPSFLGCSGCSWARTSEAGVKNNATAVARIVRVIIGYCLRFRCFGCSTREPLFLFPFDYFAIWQGRALITPQAKPIIKRCEDWNRGSRDIEHVQKQPSLVTANT